MKRKSKTAKDRAPAAQIAKLAQISISRVCRLRQEGRSDSEIIAAAAQRREAQALLRNLPVVPINTVVPINGATNGHAGDCTLTYSAALTQKENWLAELRKIEVMKARRELVPVSYMKLWGTRFLVAAHDELLRGPGELADALAAESDPVECAKIVRAWVERVLQKLCECEKLWGPPIDEDAA
jgi:hypothetical protein